MKFKTLFSIFIAGSFGMQAAQAALLDIGDDARTELALDIYNQDLAVVNDARRISLPEGGSTLNFQAISPQIDPVTTVLSPQPASLSIVQQIYQAPVSAAYLLARAVGQTVTLVSPAPLNGAPARSRAKVISVEGDGLFEVNGKYEAGLNGRQIIYDQLPDGVQVPTFSIDVINDRAGDAVLTLSYQTRGLRWQADYIARLNADRDRMQLRAMATLNNGSGMDYPNARISLIAGTVNRAPQAPLAERVMMATARDTATAPSVEALGDLYRYALPGRVDLPRDTMRQVQLFEARDVPVSLRYRLTGQTNIYYSPNFPEQTLPVDSYVDFKNADGQQPGRPMPAGTIRLYLESPESSRLSFIGEDQISHTPGQATVSLKTGKAFDIRGSRRQIAFRRLPVEQPYRQNREVELETRLTNAKSVPVTVEVLENFSGEWELQQGPAPDQALARSAIWKLEIPAGGEASLKIRVRIKN